MGSKINTSNSLGESSPSGHLHRIKYLFGLLACIAAINLTIVAAPSDLDTTFGTNGALFSSPDGTINNRGYKTVLQPDGKIVMVGSRSPATTGFIVVRYNSNGSLDATFGSNGVVSSTFGGGTESAIGVAIQPDGKIVVGGQATFPNANNQDIAVARFNTNGSVDTSFGTNGVAVVAFVDPFSGNYPDYFGAIKIAGDGKIVVGGSVPNNPGSANQHTTLARLNTDGTFDTSFGTSGKVVDTGYGWNDLVVLSDGAVVAVGFISNSSSDVMLARKYTAGGVRDWEYTRGQSNVYAQLNGIAATADGKFVVVGSYGNSPSSFRLNSNGTLDSTFAVDSVTRQGRNTSVALQSDGKPVISTVLSDVSISSFGVIRLTANGAPDTTFGSGGVVATPYPLVQIIPLTVIVQPDGKILVAGNANRSSPTGYQFALARYVGDTPALAPRASFDYDGDGKADVSVMRPSENRWYILKSANSTLSQFDFGTGGDVVVPADYDGDRKTDVAIFRPSTGAWWYIASGSGAYRAVQWGQNGDVPRPSDFDGDGKTDFVVFRPSNGVWYRLNDAGQSSQIAFGLSDDKPLVGDFDGDGKSDPAIYRPSTGAWWYAASGSSYAHRAVQFGVSTDVPTPADFDGDGKTDLAVYRPSNGVWHVLKSGSQSYAATQFGDASDKPVAADYDGDGKADIGVFRPSNGSWYLMRSTSGFSGVQWGASSDVPTQNSFVQ